MPRNTVEKELSDLAALSKRRDDPEAARKLSAALGSKVCFVAARAAELAGEFRLNSLAGDLIGAFDRFLNNPKIQDQGCSAKTAIAKALYELGEPTAEAVFLAGIEYFEMAGGYGSPIDVAAELRGYCGLGLVRIASRQAMPRLVDLLNDPARQARMVAARALVYSGRDEAALLLRLRLLIGDRDSDVMNECFNSLVRIRQPDIVRFLVRFFDNTDPDIRTSVALSLGETRDGNALDALQVQHRSETDPDVRRAIVLAATTLRLPAATDWVVQLIESSGVNDAVDAIEAMGMFKRDQTIAERTRVAAGKRKEAKIAEAFSKYFAT